MCDANRIYDAWKETEAYRQLNDFKQAIRAHDLELLEQELKAEGLGFLDDEDQAKAIRAYEEGKKERQELDNLLLNCIRGALTLCVLFLIILSYALIN